MPLKVIFTNQINALLSQHLFRVKTIWQYNVLVSTWNTLLKRNLVRTLHTTIDTHLSERKSSVPSQIWWFKPLWIVSNDILVEYFNEIWQNLVYKIKSEQLKYSTKDNFNINRLAFLAVNVLENVSCLRIACYLNFI